MTATALKADRRTLDEVRSYLDYTEGVEQRLFRMSTDANVGFTLDRDKANELGAGEELVPGLAHPYLSFHIGDDEFAVSNESVVKAFKEAGLPSKLVKEAPLRLTEPLLNYAFTNKGTEFKALVKDGLIISFCRPGTEVYSTKSLLDAIVEGNMVEENVGIINFFHNIEETHFTILDDTVSMRLPDGSVLSGGIQFQSSLIGLKPLKLDVFVMRTTERETGGERELYEGGSMSAAINPKAWDRTNDQKRIGLEPEAAAKLGTAYDFASMASSTILGEVNEEFERVAHLRDHALDQRVGPYLRDIIAQHKLKPKLWRPIMHEFAHSESERTALDLWMAFGHVGLQSEDTGVPEMTTRLKRMMFETAGEIAKNPSMCSKCYRSLADITDGL